MIDISELEYHRQKLQKRLDQKKTQIERNKTGQFATPFQLAKDILNHVDKLLPKSAKLYFLDPGFGTGSFWSALLDIFSIDRIATATGYEIDPYYGKPTQELWRNTPLELHLKDFTTQEYPPAETEKYNLIVCNPPYVRHHHIRNDDKIRLQKQVVEVSRLNLSGLSGLYCYFLILSHGWMRKNGVAAWLIPSEFMDVNYGKIVKKYLLNHVTLLQIHRFDPNEIQFDDALVSSVVVWFKNARPPKDHQVKFTFGGTIDHPNHERNLPIAILINEAKWTRFPLSQKQKKTMYPKLNEFFTIKRGIATGDNDFFVLTLDKIKEKKLPLSQFKPILPSPRILEETEIQADQNGYPLIKKQLFVLDCKLPPETIKNNHPELWQYLEEGIQKGVTERYLCKHRKIWYAQEHRSSSAIYCTYIGRFGKNGEKPFRFILNHSKAIVTNVYLMLYPKQNLNYVIEKNPTLIENIVNILNGITAQTMLDEGRVYGGGLYKLEPNELGNLDVTPLVEMLNNKQYEKGSIQQLLFNKI